MKKAATIFVVGAAAALGIAACGSSNNNSSSNTTAAANTATTPATGGGGTETVNIAASPSSIAFTTTNLKAKPGAATINFDNPSSIGHDVVLSDSSGAEVGKTSVITSSKASFTATLKPGTYTFICSVPGHSATMHGTLTVK